MKDTTNFRGVVDGQEFDNLECFKDYIANHPGAKHITFEMGQKSDDTGALEGLYAEEAARHAKAMNEYMKKHELERRRAMQEFEKRQMQEAAAAGKPCRGDALPVLITPDEYLANNPQELWIQNLDQVTEANKLYLSKHEAYVQGLPAAQLDEHEDQLSNLKTQTMEAIGQTDEASKSIEDKLQKYQDELVELNKKRKEIHERINEIRNKEIPYCRGKQYPLIASRRLLEIYNDTFKYAEAQIANEKNRRDGLLGKPLNELKPKVIIPQRKVLRPGVLYPPHGVPVANLPGIVDYAKLDKLLSAIFQ